MNRSRVLLAVVSFATLAACAGQAPHRAAPKGTWSTAWSWCDPYAFDTGPGGYPPTWRCEGAAAPVAAAPAPAPAPAPVAAAPAPAPAPERKPPPPAASPATFDPPAGTFPSAQRVALSSETSGAVIHYTTDGSTPTASSPRYAGPIEVDKTTKVRALVTAHGAPSSDVSEAEYVISPPPPPVSTARVKVTEKKLELLEKVYFDTGKTSIKPSSLPLLDEVAQVLGANAGVKKVIVEGHTDDVGAPDKNLKLSQGRAAAVREYLVKKGVAGDRLEAKGFGETRPIADNKTPAGRDANRRVEFVIP